MCLWNSAQKETVLNVYEAGKKYIVKSAYGFSSVVDPDPVP